MSVKSATVFAVTGACLLLVNTANNLAEINRSAFAWDTTGIVIALAITSAVLSLFLARIWSRSRIGAIAAAVLIVGCSGISVGLTIDRIGGVQQDRAALDRDVNGRIQRLETEIQQWAQRADEERPIAARECRGYRDGTSDPRLWPKCLTARSLVADYDHKAETARQKRARLGEPKETRRHSEKFARILFGAKAGNIVQTMRPVLTALLLEASTALTLALAGLFLAGGHRRDAMRDVDKPVFADPVRAALRRGPASNKELARRLGWTESRTSRSVKRLAMQGLVRCRKEGQRNRITLVSD